MSQIASAYIVSTEVLSALGQCAVVGNHEMYWKTLQTQAWPLPDFEHSGYVVAVLAEFVEESGCIIPANTSHPAAQAIVEKRNDVLLCANHEDVGPTLQSFGQLTADEQTLRQYFGEFTGGEWQEAGAAMQDALAFLQGGLRQIQNTNAWLLVFVG